MPRTQTNPKPNHSLYPILVLALAAFVFNTTEFIPIALLSDIGASFAISSEKTGIIMTIYAWIVAILSLPMMLLTARFERRGLLMWVFGLFVLGHGLSFLASNFKILILSRTMIALAHAIFWSITASLAVRLAPQGMQTKALGLLATGGALAMVAGLPLGRIFGQWLGWRSSFGVIGLAGLMIIGLFYVFLPRLPAKNTGNLTSLPHILNNKILIGYYLLVALVISAHFIVYSYIEPFILKQTPFGQNFATMILLIFGIAGMVASALFGHYYEKQPRAFVYFAFMGMMLPMLLLILLSNTPYLWASVVFVWGTAMTALALSLQVGILKSSPNATDVAMSLFSAIFNVGIGAGALLGSLVITHVGLHAIGYVGFAVMFMAILLFWYTPKPKI